MLRISDRDLSRAAVHVSVKHSGFTQDISPGGMRVIITGRLQKCSITHVKLALPDGGPEIVCRCRVVWCEPSETDEGMFEAGLEFDDLSDADRCRLLEHEVREREKRPSSGAPSQQE